MKENYLRLKKVGKPDKCYKTDEPCGHYTKWLGLGLGEATHKKTNMGLLYLHEVSRVVQLIEQKVEGDCQGFREGGNDELLSVCRVSVLRDDKVLEIGCTP